jgi:predicted dehydrogenase
MTFNQHPKTLKWGIIGLGRIAHTFADALKYVHSPLVACASTSLDRATSFAQQYQIKHQYSSYLDLYQDPEVDIVYIATPHSHHFEQMMDILDHGKHILCEKSFTLNHAQALKVFLKAKAKNLFVMEGLWSHFLPIWQKLSKEITLKTIGKVQSVHATLAFDGRERGQPRLFDPHLGGGALLDLSVYVLNFAWLILGHPKEIDSTLIMEHGVDVEDKITLIYQDAKAHLFSSLVRDLPRDNWIYGTEGSIYIPQFHRAESYQVFDKMNKLVKTVNVPHLLNGFEYQIVATELSILSGAIESTIHPSVTTLKMMKIMDQIRQKHQFKYPQET